MATHAQDQIDIKLLQYGAGNVYRPGEVNGMEIELTSRMPSDKSVWIQWDHETPDGDVIAYGRQVTLSPGQPRTTWLNVPLSPDTTLDSQNSIRVRELTDGEPGQDLGVHQFKPIFVSPRLIPRNTNLVGIIGTRTAGLEFYERSPEFIPNFNIAGEPTALGSMPVSSKLPDSWAGLRTYETLVWTNTEVELSPAQEQALIEWMERGGHLVIVLPQAGNPWNLGSGEDGPLGSIMPGSPAVDESVPLMSVLPQLVKQLPRTAPTGSIPVHVFRSQSGEINVAPQEDGWIDIWSVNGVGCVAVQRPVGRGLLSVVGVDLAANSLRDSVIVNPGESASPIESIPEPDVFWNRILGRRGDTPLSRSLNELRAEERLVLTAPDVRVVGDSLISAETDDVGQVGGGLLIAFLLFITYWLFAIPLCWGVLKKRRWLHWSWMGFFIVSILFSVIAWILVATTRESSIHARHLTVIDSVHGQDQQRAITWMSLFTPGYADHELVIKGDGDDLILPWEPSENRLSGFPDRRQTSVDSGRGSNSMVIPSRSTTTPLQLDWRGPIALSDWGDVLRMDPQRPVHVVRDRDGIATGIRGSVISRLPGELEDVQVIFVDKQHPMARPSEVVDGKKMSWVQPSESGRMERIGWHWAMGEDVPEGGYIIFDNLKLDPQFNLEQSVKTRYSGHREQIGTSLNPMNSGERRRALEALSIFHQLEPPTWIRQAGEKRDADHAITTRLVGRELDLSALMSQPVVIITGFLPASELPIPLMVNGEPVESSEGLVMVRWILPLQEEASSTDSPTKRG